jgi:riboflavin kinase/FMN adenylyltransferase
MLTVQNTSDFRIESNAIVTIGTFDGIHLGHQKILKRLRELKEQTGYLTVILTFDPHPRKVLFPEQNDLKILTVSDEKLQLLERHGVDVTVIYPFTREFSSIDAGEYVSRILVRQLRTKYLVIGYDHKFGHKRSGDIHTLRSFSKQFDFTVEEISRQDIDSMGVSSSRIRKALEEGNIASATENLGHRYTMAARVVKGKQLGRSLGYPTANLEPLSDDKLVPGHGIYFVSVELGKEKHFAMMSIGVNPTTDKDAHRKIEAHLFDFSQDIYDKRVSITFFEKIREEARFSGLEQLKLALAKDEEMCRRLIAMHEQRKLA